MKKRWISLLLALMMVLTLLPLGALGADADNVKQYSHYVCIGDSIAAGYGAYARDVRGFTTVPEAYHSLVAEATGASVQSLAHTGMRTVEVRWLLDDNYSASATASSLRAMYFNGLHDILYWMEMTKDDPNDPLLARYADPESEYYIRPNVRELLAPYCEKGGYGFKQFYRDQIESSDLVTVALGLNDIFLYAMKMTASELNYLNLVTEVLEFVRYMGIGENAFKNNWSPIIKAIHNLNPDAEIVVVGMYNPFSKVPDFYEGDLKIVGNAADQMVKRLNDYMKSRASSLGYRYADVTATEIDDTVPFRDETFFDRIVMDCHPTVAGHRYMADQILAQLPERGDDPPVTPTPTPTPTPAPVNPFTDVEKDSYCYEDRKSVV